MNIAERLDDVVTGSRAAWLARVFRTAGGLRVTRWLTRGEPRILMYHRFGPGDPSQRLSAEAFEWQVRHLKEYFSVVSMSTLGDMLMRGQAVPANTAVITIDDGYEDFYRYAFPVLKRHALPATFYVTSGFVDRELWLWTDVVEYIIRNTAVHSWNLEMHGKTRSFALVRPADARAAWIEICQYCMELADVERSWFLREFATLLRVAVPSEPIDGYQAASWPQLREMSHAGIEVAAHTVTHPRLTKVGSERCAIEISSCKQRIEQMIGRPVHSFAYPNGQRADYDDQVKRLVRQAGYTNAAVAFPKTRMDDPLELGRYSIGADLGEFRKILWGARSIASRLREAWAAA